MFYYGIIVLNNHLFAYEKHYVSKLLLQWLIIKSTK